jgi:hypothetical protein
MRTWLALDLSLKSTGFAFWHSESEPPVLGHCELAPDMKWRGRGYVRLHKLLLELHATAAIDHIAYEEPLTQASLSGQTNIQTLQTLTGLAAHAESFAAAVGATAQAVNISSWRRHFIGSMPRGTKTVDFKHLARSRAIELGFDPACSDESDAIGILDYQLSVSGVIPPWRAGSVLTRELAPATDGRAAHGARR